MAISTWEEQREFERQEYAKSRKATRAKLCQVFKLLGFEPEADRETVEMWGPDVRLSAHQDDMTINAEANTYSTRDRVRFYVSYPKAKKGESYNRDWPKPEASCTLAKTPEKLADEVARRVMPEYLRGLEMARAANLKTDAYHDARDNNLRSLWGRDLTDQEKREGTSRMDGIERVNDIYGDVQAFEDTVNLKLYSIPVDVAVKIMKLIRKS